MKKERSIGVGIISVMEIAWGSILFLFSLLLMIDALRPSAVGKSALGIVLGPLVGIGAIAILTMGMLTFKLKSFGRILNLLLFSLAIIGYVISPGASIPALIVFPYIAVPIKLILVDVFMLPSSVPTYIGIVIFLLLIIYFIHPKVKKQFK